MGQYGEHDEEFVRQFVIAAHSNLERVKEVVGEHPDLLNVVYDWGPGGKETPLGAASHVGNEPIAVWLLEQGAPLTICTAAMLGQQEDVAGMLADDPAQATAKGAHGIPLMFHVALSGDVAIAEMVVEHGGGEGLDHALQGAVMKNRPAMVAWLLAQGADASRTDHQGRTALEVAEAQSYEEIAALLRKA